MMCAQRSLPILVYHTWNMFNTAQIAEIERHVWLEMEKIGLTLQQNNLSFADIAREFNKSEEEIKWEISEALKIEWVKEYAGIYRRWHWEIVHPMPDIIKIPGN